MLVNYLSKEIQEISFVVKILHWNILIKIVLHQDF
ncbi:unnamed protein product [Schistosoma curassoni]|uniref:Uncharacterized protein n=1 Tax=Schistosoma curassoni TaxID=6186 RepID=A0A183JS94_9TREM|nr:unnamed protein product [Schistosoma curassoni]